MTFPMILMWTSRRYDSGIMPQARHMVLLEGTLDSPILRTRPGFALRYPAIFLYVLISASFMMQITAIGETFDKFYNLPAPSNFINKGVLSGLREIRKRGLGSDTFIFCESLEHIPKKEMAAAFEIIKDMLTATSGLLVITNWIHFHPIESVDMSWNHMTTIDDATYDLLASHAKSTAFRRGSHLVLRF